MSPHCELCGSVAGRIVQVRNRDGLHPIAACRGCVPTGEGASRERKYGVTD
jgi:hypothetical protein